MKSLGKMLQVIALIILPLAILMELNGSPGRDRPVADMLVMMGFGIACFGIGRLVEGYAAQ